jgi:hypothetical protein
MHNFKVKGKVKKVKLSLSHEDLWRNNTTVLALGTGWR